MRPAKLQRGQILRELPGLVGALLTVPEVLDSVLEDLSADPGIPDADVDGVPEALDEERFDADFEGRH